MRFQKRLDLEDIKECQERMHALGINDREVVDESTRWKKNVKLQILITESRNQLNNNISTMICKVLSLRMILVKFMTQTSTIS